MVTEGAAASIVKDVVGGFEDELLDSTVPKTIIPLPLKLRETVDPAVEVL